MHDPILDYRGPEPSPDPRRHRPLILFALLMPFVLFGLILLLLVLGILTP